MELDWITIIIALVAIAIVWKIIKGIVKFAAIGAILLGAYYLFSNGSLSEMLA